MPAHANTLESAWKYVDKREPDECWPWTGRINRYGVYGVKRKYYRAHRIIYFLTNPGAISLKLQGKYSKESRLILHTCDNPICCNPKHLYLGSNKENARDRSVRKGNYWKVSTDAPAAKLTADQVRHIRQLRKDGLLFREIAEKYGLSYSCITHIANRKHYADID